MNESIWQRNKKRNIEDVGVSRVQNIQETSYSRTPAAYQSTDGKRIRNFSVLVFDIFGLLSMIL